MYDRGSRSLWSQVDGRALAGPAVGQSLTKIPSQVTTWARWKAQHPDTLVLVKPAIEAAPYTSYYEQAPWVGLPWTRLRNDDRLPGKTLVLGVELEASGALAVGLERLEEERSLNGEAAGLPVWVVSPGDPRAALAYVRRVGERELELAVQEGAEDELIYVDRQTGSHWDWQTGVALSGPLAGERLPPLPTTPVFWATWTAFHPATELW